MNEVQDINAEPPRILGRVLAKETTTQELEEALGAARPTFSLSWPPDHD